MQVVQVYHHDPYNKGQGGVVRYLTYLLKYLPRKGVKVILLGANIFNLTLTGVDTGSILFYPIIKGSNTWWKYLINLIIKLPFIKIPNNAIIHIHRIEYVLPFIIWKRRNPIILTLHGERLATAQYQLLKTIRIKNKILFIIIYLFLDLFYRILEHLAFKRSSIIVAVSNRVKESFEKVHRDISNKLVVLPVGVDLEIFKPMDKIHLREKYGVDKNAKVILFAGVLRKLKMLNYC